MYKRKNFPLPQMLFFICFALASTPEAEPVTINPIGNENLTLYNENGELAERVEFKLNVNGENKPKVKNEAIYFALYAAILPAKTYEDDPYLFENAVVDMKEEDLKKFNFLLDGRITHKILADKKNTSFGEFFLAPNLVNPTAEEETKLEIKATFELNEENELSKLNINLNNLSALKIQKEDAEKKTYALVFMTIHKNSEGELGIYNYSSKILIESAEKKNETVNAQPDPTKNPLVNPNATKFSEVHKEGIHKITEGDPTKLLKTPLQEYKRIEENSQETEETPLQQTTEQGSYFSTGFIIKAVIILSIIISGLYFVYIKFMNEIEGEFQDNLIQ